MKKIWILCLVLFGLLAPAIASDGDRFFQVGTGILYERGWDLTVGIEQETRYHNAWEYFGNVYLKWEDCASCGHICPESFWKSYNTWALGAAYKPSLMRKRNSVGCARLGISMGSDKNEFLAGLHIGYEQNYTLHNGMVLYWQVKSDLMINGKDLFRTGVVLGVKLPFK
jgi:hypothetical protein